MKAIDWSAQHCGVHQATIGIVRELMPDLAELLDTFPDMAERFTWDVKVHMLMPRQYPCIPNWHRDYVPREGGRQRFDLIDPKVGMYFWISGPPLTQFRDGYAAAGEWHRFTQMDEHRGTAAADFCWRGFIRAIPRELQPPKASGHLRRHTQVYLDAETFQW